MWIYAAAGREEGLTPERLENFGQFRIRDCAGVVHDDAGLKQFILSKMYALNYVTTIIEDSFDVFRVDRTPAINNLFGHITAVLT